MICGAPETGSVTPGSPSRSSSMTSKLSKNAIISGRASAIRSKIRHWPTKLNVLSPVPIGCPP